MGKRHTFMTWKKSLIICTENYCITKVRPAEIKFPRITCYQFNGTLDEVVSHASIGCKHSDKKKKNPATFIHNLSVSDTAGSGLHKIDSGATGLTGRE